MDNIKHVSLVKMFQKLHVAFFIYPFYINIILCISLPGTKFTEIKLSSYSRENISTSCKKENVTVFIEVVV
jgi:hypothetical protein